MDTLWKLNIPTTDNGPYNNNYEQGTRFSVVATCYLRGMRWYRKDSTSAEAINGWRLWDLTNHAVVYTPADTPDSGAVGWQEHTVTSLVLLQPGIVYCVTSQTHNGGKLSMNMAPPGWAPDALLTFNANAYGATAGSYGEPINTVNNLYTHGADVTVDAVAPAQPAPPTIAQIDAKTAEWQSSSAIVNTHQADGLPWLTKADTAATRTAAGNISAQTVDWAFGLGAAAHGYYELMRGLLQTVKNNVDDLPDVIQAIVDVMIDHLDGEITTILAAIDNVLSNLGAQSTDLSGTAGSAVGAISGRTGFPSTGWTMTATEDFDTSIAFAEVADAYVVTITSYQATQPATETAAGLWLYRLGWWCVLTGSLASRREYVEFGQQLLSDGGRRMAGCAIELKPGTLATVQAWVLA